MEAMVTKVTPHSQSWQFRRTATIAIVGWLAIAMLLKGLYFAFQGVSVVQGSIFFCLTFCLEGAHGGVYSAIVFQVGVWWLWRYPNDSRLITLVLLCGLFVVPILYRIAESSLIDSSAFGGNLPPAIWAQWLISAALIVPWHLAAMAALAPIVSLRLVDQDRIDDIQGHGRSWTIGGLMLLTFLFAAGFASHQWIVQILEKHFASSDVHFVPGNSFGLLATHFLQLLISTCVVVVAAWAAIPRPSNARRSKRRDKSMRFVLLMIAALASASVHLLYSVVCSEALEDYFFWSNHVLTTLLHCLFEMVALYLISVWFFHRWQHAGYQISHRVAWSAKAPLRTMPPTP
jgi:hypothetical protein